MRIASAKSLLLILVIPALLWAAEENDHSSKEDRSFDNGGRSDWPFQSRLVVNPVIQEMLESVSPDIIMSNLETLVDFYTRHTNSDTMSSDVGVGAARRWIYERFEEYSTDPNSFALEPGYFTFDASVCGVEGEHRNVMATMSGVETPFRYFIDMGHMDSRTINVCDDTSFAPSANDDGSGTVVAMEMARVMSRYPFESTVVIMIVTGEDQGLYGSTAYANWAFYQGVDVQAAFTNDVVGNIEGCEDPACPPEEPVIIDSTSVRHFSGPPATGPSRRLTRYMKLKGMEYLPDFTINLIPALDRPGRSGDHVPFHNWGFPAARFTEANENGDGSGYNGRQHNEHDIISPMNTNAGYMANIAKINIAGMASLALAPMVPSGLEVFDMGDGERAHLVWPDEQVEPDFSGYRIAIRLEEELFYADILDVGYVNEYTIEDLSEGTAVYLSISAYDNDGNESLFSDEVEFIPASVPGAPTGFDATSRQSGVYLTWELNDELDIAGYRIYRQDPDQQPELVATIDHPENSWHDESVEPHTLYTYYVSAFDEDEMESPYSQPVLGQKATHDSGIIVIDGTIDGSGNPYQPTDLEVDEYYSQILQQYNIGGHWDVVDSNSVDVRFEDAHLAPFSTVFLHSDRPGSQLYPDTTALRKYLENGGNLFLCGWNLSLALAQVIDEFADFPEGSFFQEILKVDSIGVSPTQDRDFIYAPSSMPEFYPDLVIDTSKAPLFDHRLFKMEAFLGDLIDMPITEPIHNYESSIADSSLLHGKPVGLRYIGDDYRMVLIDVPLFFMKRQESAMPAISRAMENLGEVQSGVEDAVEPPVSTKVTLHENYPNPFNATTTISFSLPEDDYISLEIYNLLGQKVESLVEGKLTAGIHVVGWDAAGRPSGIYFARLSWSHGTMNIRLTLLK
jgi:hypothetical protein